MKFRKTHAAPTAGAKAGFSTTTAYRLEADPSALSRASPPRSRRRPDPLADIFEADVVPMLIAAPGLRGRSLPQGDPPSAGGRQTFPGRGRGRTAVVASGPRAAGRTAP